MDKKRESEKERERGRETESGWDEWRGAERCGLAFAPFPDQGGVAAISHCKIYILDQASISTLVSWFFSLLQKITNIVAFTNCREKKNRR